jgi:hypothetical protein
MGVGVLVDLEVALHLEVDVAIRILFVSCRSFGRIVTISVNVTDCHWLNRTISSWCWRSRGSARRGRSSRPSH